MAANVRLHRNRKGDTELVIALACGATVKEAAERAGVSERTAFRRLQEPGFRVDIQDTRSLLVTQTIGKLIDAGSDAAETLRLLLNAKAEHVRLGSARAILETMPKLRESQELVDRIAALEKRLEEEQRARERSRAWEA